MRKGFGLEGLSAIQPSSDPDVTPGRHNREYRYFLFPTGRRAKISDEEHPAVCPECREAFCGVDQWDLLGAHIEIHRPVGERREGAPYGKHGWSSCPKGCGRLVFLSNTSAGEEYRHHVSVCTGVNFWPNGVRIGI